MGFIINSLPCSRTSSTLGEILSNENFLLSLNECDYYVHGDGRWKKLENMSISADFLLFFLLFVIPKKETIGYFLRHTHYKIFLSIGKVNRRLNFCTFFMKNCKNSHTIQRNPPMM